NKIPAVEFVGNFVPKTSFDDPFPSSATAYPLCATITYDDAKSNNKNIAFFVIIKKKGKKKNFFLIEETKKEKKGHIKQFKCLVLHLHHYRAFFAQIASIELIRKLVLFEAPM